MFALLAVIQMGASRLICSNFCVDIRVRISAQRKGPTMRACNARTQNVDAVVRFDAFHSLYGLMFFHAKWVRVHMQDKQVRIRCAQVPIWCVSEEGGKHLESLKVCMQNKS